MCAGSPYLMLPEKFYFQGFDSSFQTVLRSKDKTTGFSFLRNGFLNTGARGWPPEILLDEFYQYEFFGFVFKRN